MTVVVTLMYPNGQRIDAKLVGVPRVGEQIRLRNGPTAPSLVVDHVQWVEVAGADDEPCVIVSVRPRDE